MRISTKANIKTILRGLLVISLLCACLMTVLSCGSAQYKDDLPGKVLGAGVMSRPDTPDPADFKVEDSRFVSLYMGLGDLDESTYIIYRTNSSVRYDEIGFFKCDSAKAADELAAKIQKYLDDKKESDIPTAKGYAPDEVPKLENAKVGVYGVYVVYTVLNKNDTDSVEKAVGQILKP